LAQVAYLGWIVASLIILQSVLAALQRRILILTPTANVDRVRRSFSLAPRVAVLYSITVERILAVILEKEILLLVVFVMFFSTGTTPVIATEPVPDKNGVGWLHEVRVGVLAHDVNHLWSGTRKEGGIDLNGEIIFSRPSFSLLSGNVRPNLGASINTEGDTSKIYGGILWQSETKSGIFFDLGVGIAVHNGELDTDDDDKKSLGSSVLFRIPIEIGYSITAQHRISILFDHISNANLADPNEGLDTLGLRYGYRF
jgi:hypothetical protein